MTTHHRISTTLAAAVALALGAGAGPASAMPYGLNANGSSVPAAINAPSDVGQVSSPVPCGDGCFGHRYRSASGQPTPGQQAQLNSYQQTVAKQFGATPGGLAGPAVRAPSANDGSGRRSDVSPSQGFRWGDAGIGAAGGLVLSMLGIGGVMAISQRRTRRSKTAVTS